MMEDDVRITTMTMGSPLWALLPLAALVFLIIYERGRVERKDTLWLFPSHLMLTTTTIWYALGIGVDSPLVLLLVSILAPLSCGLIYRREEMHLKAPIALVATTILATLSSELCWNEQILGIGPQFALVELALIGGFIGFLWFVSGRKGAPVAIFCIFLTCVGICQHYVLEFRGTSVLPSDVLAFGTALSVSTSYTYTLSQSLLLAEVALDWAIAFSSLLSHTQRKGEPNFVTDLVLGLVSLGLTAALAFVPAYGPTFGAYIDYWWSKDWYSRQGFFPSFIYACQDLEIKRPRGFTPMAAKDRTEKLEAVYEKERGSSDDRRAAATQFTDLRPNVLIIQNETFCDLSAIADMGYGYEGPTYMLRGIDDALLSGDFAVSVFGGGTCNTEFEFLCGHSLAFVGTSKYPFSMYDLSVSDSLPRDFGAVGYTTIGMHPNVPTNWNRHHAYEGLGFDQFLAIDDFDEDAELFHTHVSDWATYEKSLDLIKDTDEPLFIFDVTMQNHSGYDTGSIPEDLMPPTKVKGLSEEDDFELREFIACINESDKALEKLIGALRDFDEPVVVVMYGDHHPWLSDNLNDLFHTPEDELTHSERIHNTSYIVWANYDVKGAENLDRLDHTSANLLAATLLDTIGAPVTDYQKALLGVRIEGVRAINANGWRDADDVWHPLSERNETVDDLAIIEYETFGVKV